ncbi:MAG: citryl-CoA lyase [Methanobacterium paludis]|nr:citryl-CoA lyase [Methanobacterium paludis]
MITEEVLRGMFKPRQSPWKTSITKVELNRLTTRGHLQEDLIGNISFPEMVYLLIKGDMPLENQKKMLESVLVSFCDHGITPPSTQAARLMASAGSPVNACIAGGILAFGQNHAGAIEIAMKTFQEGVKLSKMYNRTVNETAQNIVADFKSIGKKIPGYGHRYHTEDPRAKKLIEVAEKYGCYGEHLELAVKIEEILFDNKGIKMNIDGANAAILSDMGLNWRFGPGIFIIGRVPGILAHVNEEMESETPFRKMMELDEF